VARQHERASHTGQDEEHFLASPERPQHALDSRRTEPPQRLEPLGIVLKGHPGMMRWHRGVGQVKVNIVAASAQPRITHGAGEGWKGFVIIDR